MNDEKNGKGKMKSYISDVLVLIEKVIPLYYKQNPFSTSLKNSTR